ncbi:MAG: hypothetical protein ABL986_08425 [Vicinamibacterales bacterium]
MASLSPLVWMSAASAIAAGAAIGGGAPPAGVLWGMAGPLVAASVTWVLVSRTYRSSPESVTGVMMKAFAGKMLFFAAYVVMMLRGLAVPATPFVVSFTAYFIGIYVMEALFLQRLFVGTR